MCANACLILISAACVRSLRPSLWRKVMVATRVSFGPTVLQQWMSVDRKGNNVTELCPTKDKAW
jgi:hypothetical protein